MAVLYLGVEGLSSRVAAHAVVVEEVELMWGNEVGDVEIHGGVVPWG